MGQLDIWPDLSAALPAPRLQGVLHLSQGDGLHQPLQAGGEGIGLKRQSQWG